MRSKLDSVARDATEGSFFLFTGSALSTFILGLSTIIVARLLGPEAYGLYSVVLIVPYLLTLFLDWGVNPAMVKFSAQFSEEGKGWLVAHLIKTGLLFKLTFSLVVFTATFLFSDFFVAYLLRRSELSFFIRLVSLVLVSQSIFTASANVFVGLGRMEHNALILVLQATSKALTSSILVFLGFGLLGAVTAHVLSSVTSGLTGAYILHKHYKALSNPGGNISSLNSLKIMVGYGLPPLHIQPSYWFSRSISRRINGSACFRCRNR